ncbi:MAG: branched-chain amino acid transporter ATP-binding protein [Bradyrhizobium sp.]|jgi:branched-chain amino acid transport system ATP-binding protein|nr:branched-chain amino acid transporter ATP-binding protein [Bradyrhizobium sp.]
MTLRLTNFCAGYGRVPVVRDISLDIGEGRIVGLLGANGAGKTTLMRAVSGLATMQGGSVEFAGSDVTGVSSAQRVARGLIQVPQGRHLFGEMSVRENLEMGAYLVVDRVARARLLDVFSLFPILRERERQPAALLSGGEQQMLAVGRALMSGPRCLLMDEPSLGLAPKTFDLILEVVKRINGDGTTIFIAEQNARKVLRVAHYCYVMENGRIATEGESTALLADDRIQRLYLGVAHS